MPESLSKFQTPPRELFQFGCAGLDSRGAWLGNEYLGNLTFE